MDIVSVGMTDVGLKRSHNEDTFLINDALGLFVVADGMGGHAGGDVASEMAVLTIENTFSERRLVDNAGSVSDCLHDAVTVAGLAVHERAQAGDGYQGMGTTIVAVVVHDGSATVAHVGDSRCYHLHATQLTQVTNDHSLVNEKVQAGLLSAEEAKTHRLRNVITRSLGFEPAVQVDLTEVCLVAGDQLLLCSDGLTGLVTAAEIQRLLIDTGPDDAARNLVELALSRGGDDNITVVIILSEVTP